MGRGAEDEEVFTSVAAIGTFPLLTRGTESIYCQDAQISSTDGAICGLQSTYSRVRSFGAEINPAHVRLHEERGDSLWNSRLRKILGSAH